MTPCHPFVFSLTPLLLLLPLLPCLTRLLLPLLPACSYGVGRLGWLSLTGFVPTRMKSRNIEGFVDRYRQQLLVQV